MERDVSFILRRGSSMDVSFVDFSLVSDSFCFLTLNVPIEPLRDFASHILHIFVNSFVLPYTH